MDTGAFVLENPRACAGNEWDCGWRGKRARGRKREYKYNILNKYMYSTS